MSTPLTLRQIALQVAVLSTLLDEVKARLAAARKEAGPVFAEARKEGQTQQKVMLPDGTEIGLISIRGASPETDFDGGNAGLLAWCEEHAPHMAESYIVPGGGEMADVIALVAEHFPNLVKRRIRSGSLAELVKQVQETGGYVIDGDGEKHRVASVRRGEPTGAFAYRAGKDAKDRIMGAWLNRDGGLQELVFGTRALPAPEGGDGK